MHFVLINGRKFSWESNLTIFQFCFSKGVNIPCFCYHERLSIAGNCRMCLVEANNNLGVSCALPLIPGMVVFTESLRVIQAREGIVEFLLVNHPLDCPICDQGGECDLQDINYKFGSDRGRFYEFNKRAVTDINCFGPLIKTVMTRCIHCTRCVRFLNEVAGVFDLGVFGRGRFMEIGPFIEDTFYDELSANIIDLCPVGALAAMPFLEIGPFMEDNFFEDLSAVDLCPVGALLSMPFLEMAQFKEDDTFYDEVAANIIDLCPVGALTSMPFAHKTRMWELQSNLGIDVLDCLAASIRLDVLDNQVVRIVPKLDESVNEEWITNKTRFVYDSFNVFRLLYPKIFVLSYYVVISWFIAFKSFIFFLYSFFSCNFFAVSGYFVDLDTVFFLKVFLNSLGSSSYFFEYDLSFVFDFRFFFLLNDFVMSLECFFFCFFLGIDLRLENPLLFSRLKKSFVKNYDLFFIVSFGFCSDYLLFPIFFLGHDLNSFLSFFNGRSFIFEFFFFKNIFNFKLLNYNFSVYPFLNIFIGSSIVKRYDSIFFFDVLSNFFFNLDFLKEAFSFNVVSDCLGFISVSESCLFSKNPNMFFMGNKKIKNSFIYFLNVDLTDFIFDNSFIIYQGIFDFFKDDVFQVFLWLPSTLFVENICYFFNMEGRLRKTTKAVSKPDFVEEPFLILKALLFFKNTFFVFNFSMVLNFYKIFFFFINFLSYSCFFFSTNFFFFSKFLDFSFPIFFFKRHFSFKHSLKFLNCFFLYNSNYYFNIFTKNSKINMLVFYDKLPLLF